MATTVFHEERWVRETEELTKKVNRWFCWKRKEKLAKLTELIRTGSAHYEHGRIADRELVENTLAAAESVILGWFIRWSCPSFSPNRLTKQ